MHGGIMNKKPMNHSEFARLGGVARAEKLSPKRRKQIAKKAAKARWGNKKPCH